MRILRIFYDWPGKWDGLAPAGYEITREQVKLGHKITVMCGFWGKNPPEKIENVNIISVFREPAHGLLFFTSSVILFFKYFLWRNKYKVDVIHSHGHFAIWIYFYRKLIKNIPLLKNFEFEPVFVVHFHNTFKGRWESLKAEKKPINKISEKFFYPLGVLSDRWALEVCDKAIFVSQNLFDEAVKYYQAPIEKCSVVESGVNIELFKKVSQIERQKTRNELGFDEFDKVIINYGKMVARKNIVALVNAVALLPIHYKLVLIGDGPNDYKTEIINAIANGKLIRRVRQFGYADYRDIAVPLQAADIFVLPSDFEGLPKAILEALATEIPVVYSGFEFKEPILGSLKLVEKTPQAIAEAIVKMTQNPVSTDIEKFRIMYSWKSKASAIQKIYEEVLESRR